jgi:hypothetical protein
MPGSGSFTLRGVKQNSQVVNWSGFDNLADAQSAGDDMMASGFFVTYTVIEHTPEGDVEHHVV